MVNWEENTSLFFKSNSVQIIWKWVQFIPSCSENQIRLNSAQFDPNYDSTGEKVEQKESNNPDLFKCLIIYCYLQKMFLLYNPEKFYGGNVGISPSCMEAPLWPCRFIIKGLMALKPLRLTVRFRSVSQHHSAFCSGPDSAFSAICSVTDCR